ncbi:DUF775-domain-containing protein [Rhizodiscina lignyota]|uniref:DUF775-domain-containing protein n=1 Tax=Rhizodiscina lignyota TaxID=1504668 RepID=A0A9P4M5W9_9PEZI|nr:DUF775-domain-containing protein [Rhizodiscina lignyota]
MFAIILPGRPCLTDIQTIEPTKFAFSFPSAPHFSHIVVFILPGNVLPPDTAAGVFVQFPGSTEFRFLGAIANEKQSAIFRVHGGGMLSGGVMADGDAMTDDSRPPASLAAGDVTIGISIEPIPNIQAQLTNLQSQRPQSSSGALVKAPMGTKVLAQRIIRNAFNFLASFADGGNETVPLKAFQEWWAKFERKVENDPGFLERDDS